MVDHNHVILVGKAFIKNPPKTAEIADQWLRELVSKIDMKLLIGPHSVNCQTLGNEGVTGLVGIETSHASFHSWSEIERPFMAFDVYSCVDFEPKTVLDHLHEYFEIDEVAYTLIDRNDLAPRVIANEVLKFPQE